jgi:hypothetical protein
MTEIYVIVDVNNKFYCAYTSKEIAEKDLEKLPHGFYTLETQRENVNGCFSVYASIRKEKK